MKITTRKYITDKLGNVIKISDSVFGDCDYEYDYRGFLTKEAGITYQYDDNGNILKVGNKTFEYDSTIKDRLIKANGQTLSYYPTGNLSTWKNWTYQFEGKYLKQINHNIFYEYDMLGLRISKTMNNQKTTYLYDGNLLLTEITPTYRNDFLYDENGILYGFIHDYSTKYFYVRDVFQNILGIVDENGNLVVKYAYTAYGTLKSISGSLATTIGQYNPFRFKGYYYDQESELFSLIIDLNINISIKEIVNQHFVDFKNSNLDLSDIEHYYQISLSNKIYNSNLINEEMFKDFNVLLKCISNKISFNKQLPFIANNINNEYFNLLLDLLNENNIDSSLKTNILRVVLYSKKRDIKTINKMIKIMDQSTPEQKK